VILDLQMPNLDGFDYCERVRADVELPRMPIIVETVNDQREAKLRALSCGADDFLLKPLDMEELGLRVSIHLDRYFMMQDIQNMCLYLKMEFGEMQRVIQRVEQTNAAPHILDALQHHCEVLETMTALPARPN
jgi:DNA-binding response OmpR family regulator